jgi:hypothetical protein
MAAVTHLDALVVRTAKLVMLTSSKQLKPRCLRQVQPVAWPADADSKTAKCSMVLYNIM